MLNLYSEVIMLDLKELKALKFKKRRSITCNTIIHEFLSPLFGS